jgi:DNA primase
MNKIKEIKARLTISEVAKILAKAGYLKGLSKDGRRALCPFHQDKTPSLSLDLRKDRFRCFGCGRSGDLIDLWEGAKGIDRKQAVNELYGIATGRSFTFDQIEGFKKTGRFPEYSRPEPEPEPKPWGVEPELADKVFRSLAEFNGWTVEGAVRDYLHRRGLTDETIERFKIFSLHDTGESRKFLTKNFDLETLKALLLFDSKNRFLFYQHRLIIPIFENGLLTAIQGRYFIYQGALYNTNPPASVGKYNNGTGSGAGKLFNGDILKDLKPGSRLYLCEGAFDSMILSQEGHNAVACLSTSSWKSVIARLKGFEVVIAFDNDEAGQKAAIEIREELFKLTGQEPAILELPDGIKDINEYFIKRYKSK